MTASLLLQSLVKSAIRDLMAAQPTVATAVGIHDFDHLLGHHTSDQVAAELQMLHGYRAQFAALPEAELTPDERVDRALFTNAIDDNIQEIEIDRIYSTRPLLYTREVLMGCYFLITREFAPAPQRAESLLRRMEQVPRVLGEARAQLLNAAPVQVEVATETVAGGIGFFKAVVAAFSDQTPDLKPHLLKAGSAAAAAMQDYLDYLQGTLLPKATADFALGRDRFDWRLKHSYRLDFDSQTLHEHGWDLVRSTQAEMTALARKSFGTRDWRAVVARIKDDTPSAADLVETYRRVLAEARRFCIDRDLMDLPPGEVLQLQETPLFMRPTLAYAAYEQPAAFDEHSAGIFYVTPINTQLPQAAQAEQLSGHNWPSLKIVVLHEAYPGHHLQLSWSIRHPSPARKVLGSILFMEGWTLYCEQMMREQGWLSTREEHMIQLNDQLWRACRVVIDTGLHTRGMPIDAAIRILQDEAAVEEPSARTEVRGYYCNEPTVPMSYMVGKGELLRLKADYQRARGESFSLKQFHTDLLSHGSIPFAYLRELIGP